jgi:hypothetical protein
MRVRRLDANGDYLIGAGQANFWIDNVEAVAQSIQTRLLLWEGEWFLDNTNGTPWSQEVLGYGTTAIRDQVLKARILETPGVTSIVSFDSSLNPTTRKYTVQGQVLTKFSTQPVSFGPVNL